jgi:para-nitrobenzyl esterase
MMKSKSFLAAGFVSILFVSSNILRADDLCTEPVKTEAGLVRGMADEATKTCSWKGIPFAAPPVGELRWAPPEPHPGWEGLRETTEFGAMCMQKMASAEKLVHKTGMSEDCLFLNIWRPKKPGKFPVMLWIHGGGYTIGTASTGMYWGDRLAEAGDVVVVSTHYRLNVFGFFAHPALREEDANGSTGSQGSLDQVAAIRWVHDNIAEFGGDPENITVFGESAGGFSVCTMIATPLNQGMFHKAILQSGGCESSQDLEDGYEFAKGVSESLGCDPDDIQCLRELPAKKILKKGAVGMGQMKLVPHHDGYLLSDTPLEMIRAGNYNRVIFMAGSNRDEFGKAMKLYPRFYFTKPKDYKKRLDQGYSGGFARFELSEEETERLVELYPLEEFNNRPVEAYGRMFGVDAALACPTYLGLLAAAEQQPDTYYYRFDYDDMKFGKYTGAAHAMEIPFIFDAFDRMPTNIFYNDKNIDQAKELLRIIQGYWINFAKTGDPNGPGLPQWPIFRPGEQNVQVLDNNVRTETADIIERCSFWDSYSMDHGSLSGDSEE